MKRTTKAFALSIAALTAATTLVACGSSGSSSTTSMSSAMPMASVMGTTSANPTAIPAGTEADVTFAQLMIPHHQQAIEMSELALTKSNDDEVIKLAEQIRDAQGPEIEQMRLLLKDFGIEEDPSSHMAHMHGMLSKAEMSDLAEATGIDFDRLFLSGMIKHHEGAIDMVALVGESARLSSLGEAIFTAQNEEISKMQEMLARKG